MRIILRPVFLLVLITFLVGSGVTESRGRPPFPESVQVEGVTGNGAKWIDPVVEVRFYGPNDRWLIDKKVWDTMSALMPPNTTTFVPVHSGTGSCPDPPLIARPYIVVCYDPLMQEKTGYAAWTPMAIQNGVMLRADIVLDDAYSILPNIHCHEAMHAVTGIADDYGSEQNTSCVHGGLNLPGSFDLKFIYALYAPGVTPPPPPTEGAAKTCDRKGHGKHHHKRCHGRGGHATH